MQEYRNLARFNSIAQYMYAESNLSNAVFEKNRHKLFIRLVCTLLAISLDQSVNQSIPLSPHLHLYIPVS